MSLQSEAVGMSGAAMVRVINTDTLEFLGIRGHWISVGACRSDWKALTTRVVIPCGGLTKVLRTGRVLVFEVTYVVHVWSGGDHLSGKGGERVAAGRWY